MLSGRGLSSKCYILYDSIYIKFFKWPHFRDRKKLESRNEVGSIKVKGNGYKGVA
jgi:hypothetical protein